MPSTRRTMHSLTLKQWQSPSLLKCNDKLRSLGLEKRILANYLITTNQEFGKSITCEHDALIICICSLCKQDLHVTAYKYLLLNLNWIQSISQEDFCNSSYALHSTSHKVSAGGLQSMNTAILFKGGPSPTSVQGDQTYSVNWEERAFSSSRAHLEMFQLPSVDNAESKCLKQDLKQLILDKFNIKLISRAPYERSLSRRNCLLQITKQTYKTKPLPKMLSNLYSKQLRALSWFWWSLGIPFNSGYSVILWF